LINHPEDQGEFKVFHPRKKLEIILPRLHKGVNLIHSEISYSIGQTEIIDIDPLEVNASEPEEVIIEDLGAEELLHTLILHYLGLFHC
jgi:hypothetical protein